MPHGERIGRCGQQHGEHAGEPKPKAPPDRQKPKRDGPLAILHDEADDIARAPSDDAGNHDGRAVAAQLRKDLRVEHAEAKLQAGLPGPTPLPAAASAKWLSSIRHPTGLIIDARKVPLRPALCPAIFAEDGRLVFEVQHAQRLWFMQHGGVTYMSDLDAAKAENLLGVNPMIVEAVSVQGPNGCDIIVSDDDADRLIFLRERLPFFAECRLIIVCRPIPNNSRQ